MTTELDALFKKRKELEKQRKELDAEIEKAEDEAAEARRAPLKELAERAHTILCPFNHSDGCGWLHEKGWDGQAHQGWLRHYDRLINGNTSAKGEVTIRECTEILDAVENLKPKVSIALWLIRSGKLQP